MILLKNPILMKMNQNTHDKESVRGHIERISTESLTTYLNVKESWLVDFTLQDVHGRSN